jgi:hypothetical protein
MSEYMKFLSEQIKEQEKDNEQIVLDYWRQVYIEDNLNSKYESLVKKMTSFSQELSLKPKNLALKLLELDGLAKNQTLKLWVIKAERQNLNEEWKKNYITQNSNMEVIVLPKSGDNSLHLDENFKITFKKSKKTQSEKSKGIKTFDFKLMNSKFPNTEGFDGILTVDKTVKVTGGSQIDIQKEIDNTIAHLCNDPLKRKYLILLDGAFFYEYVQENKNKCDNIFITTTDELIKNTTSHETFRI